MSASLMLMSHSEKLEMRDAYVTRFRTGEIGPVTFRAMMTKLGIEREDIEHFKKMHESENAQEFAARHTL